jgi:hypothetical protein
MSAAWIAVGAYLGALAIVLPWMIALGRVAKDADERESRSGSAASPQLEPRAPACAPGPGAGPVRRRPNQATGAPDTWHRPSRATLHLAPAPARSERPGGPRRPRFTHEEV